MYSWSSTQVALKAEYVHDLLIPMMPEYLSDEHFYVRYSILITFLLCNEMLFMEHLYQFPQNYFMSRRLAIDLRLHKLQWMVRVWCLELLPYPQVWVRYDLSNIYHIWKCLSVIIVGLIGLLKETDDRDCWHWLLAAIISDDCWQRLLAVIVGIDCRQRFLKVIFDRDCLHRLLAEMFDKECWQRLLADMVDSECWQRLMAVIVGRDGREWLLTASVCRDCWQKLLTPFVSDDCWQWLLLVIVDRNGWQSLFQWLLTETVRGDC